MVATMANCSFFPFPDQHLYELFSYEFRLNIFPSNSCKENVSKSNSTLPHSRKSLLPPCQVLNKLYG